MRRLRRPEFAQGRAHHARIDAVGGVARRRDRVLGPDPELPQRELVLRHARRRARLRARGQDGQPRADRDRAGRRRGHPRDRRGELRPHLPPRPGHHAAHHGQRRLRADQGAGLPVRGAGPAGRGVGRGAPAHARPRETGPHLRRDVRGAVVLGRSQAHHRDARRGGAPQGVCDGERLLALRHLQQVQHLRLVPRPLRAGAGEPRPRQRGRGVGPDPRFRAARQAAHRRDLPPPPHEGARQAAADVDQRAREGRPRADAAGAALGPARRPPSSHVLAHAVGGEDRMRVARFWVPGQGARLGLCEGATVRELSSPDAPPLESFDALVQLARRTRRDLRECVQGLRGSASGSGSAYAYQDLDRAPNPGVPHLLLPVVPPEVWAAGVTYERSREARLAETTTVGIYDKVYDAERPEVFFKATPSRCVGPNAPVGIRADSRWTVPEPELGVVLGAEGEVLGYTLGNDMSARDIEGENPLYLPQTKIYRACCSLGPTILLTDEAAAGRLTITCRIAP